MHAFEPREGVHFSDDRPVTALPELRPACFDEIEHVGNRMRGSAVG